MNLLSLRCSWSIACRRCSSYIFNSDLTPDFNGLSKDKCRTRRESFKSWDWVLLRFYGKLCLLICWSKLNKLPLNPLVNPTDSICFPQTMTLWSHTMSHFRHITPQCCACIEAPASIQTKIQHEAFHHHTRKLEWYLLSHDTGMAPTWVRNGR